MSRISSSQELEISGIDISETSKGEIK